MGRLLLLAVIVLGGCRQIAGLDDPISGDGGPIDNPPGEYCYGTGLVKVCLNFEPTDVTKLSQNQTIDTSNAFGCVDPAKIISGGTGICVIAGATIELTTAVTSAVGSKPLLFVATDSISIDAPATLDAAGHRQFNSGTTAPGGTYASCVAGTNPMSGGSGSGGGQGGGFMAKGGDGGAGTSGSGGLAGTALPEPTTLHPGCSGHSGAGGDSGSKGPSGGAVYLIANNTITIAGRLDASGGGGGGAFDGPNSGGGGGGSGGMIGLDAPSVVITGAVCSIGGSGGGGSAASSSGSSSGNDALGGALACTAGTPGNGSAGSGAGGAGAANGMGSPGVMGSAGSGGGGGGSSGYIKLYGTPSGAGAILPPPA